MLLRGVVDVSVEGGLDLLRCLFKVVKNAEQQRVEEFLPNSSYHSPSSSSRVAASQSCLHSAKMMLPCSAVGCTNPSWVPAGLIPRRGPSNICSLSPSTCIAMKSMGRRRRHVHCGIPRHAPRHPPGHATPVRSFRGSQLKG